ncbi:MAG: trigger factor [bacterium]
MEITVNTISEVSCEVEIQANAAELTPHFEKAYKEYRPKVELKGFRKGKAPLELIKKFYGDMIEEESLDKVAGELYRQAIKDKELKPIGEPTLVDRSYKRGEFFRFKIQYDVRPTIELKEYKGLKLETVVHTMKESEVEDELLRLQRANSTTEEADRVTDAEFIVTVDLQDLDDTGIPIIGKKNDNVRFYLADPKLEQPFKDALKSAEKNQELRIQFEHQHGERTHKVDVKAFVKKVDKVLLPPLDDAFALTVTKEKIKTIDEFQSSIREDINAYWKEKNRRSVTNSVIGELIRMHDFQIPESLTRSVLENLLEDVKNQQPNKQFPPDFNKEKFFEQNRTYAIYQSKWALLREEIIAKENLTPSEDALVTLAEREAPKIGIDKERLINYYKSSDHIKNRLVSDVLMELLVKNATITEIDDSTLNNTLEEGS